MTPNVGFLIELCLAYVRVSTEERGEMSCGWIHLPFMENHGAPLPSRNYELQLHGKALCYIKKESEIESESEGEGWRWRESARATHAITVNSS